MAQKGPAGQPLSVSGNQELGVVEGQGPAAATACRQPELRGKGAWDLVAPALGSACTAYRGAELLLASAARNEVCAFVLE